MRFSAFAVIINMVLGLFNIGLGLITLWLGKSNSMIFSMLCAICNFLIALTVAVISKKDTI